MDESGLMFDDGMMEFSYKEITIIDNHEYYLIEGECRDSSNKLVETIIYGIDTVSGDMVNVSLSDEGDYEIK